MFKGQAFIMFLFSVGAMVVSGLLYNHVHPLVGFGSIGIFIYAGIRYRHKLFGRE